MGRPEEVGVKETSKDMRREGDACENQKGSPGRKAGDFIGPRWLSASKSNLAPPRALWASL